MAMFSLILMIFMTPSKLGYPRPRGSQKITFYTREQWGARPSNEVAELSTPVPYVIIHHTYDPGACFSYEECSEAMRTAQDAHQLEQGWADIGYNFAVGGDGAVYEGRGWTAVGAHAYGYNSLSIGIVLIGDFVSKVPTPQQLETVKKLIKIGVKLGYIDPEYSLFGHRQVGSTECPGQALFEKISTWDRFKSTV